MIDTEYGLRCESCGVDSAPYCRDRRPLTEVATLWPHIKAIVDSAPVWIEFEIKVPDVIAPNEGPNVFQFLEEHGGHRLVSIYSSNHQELSQERAPE